MKTNQAGAHRPSAVDFLPAESAFLAAAVEDGIRIQSRFQPEPSLARTGRGFMASSGVAEIATTGQLPFPRN